MLSTEHSSTKDITMSTTIMKHHAQKGDCSIGSRIVVENCSTQDDMSSQLEKIEERDLSLKMPIGAYLAKLKGALALSRNRLINKDR